MLEYAAMDTAWLIPLRDRLEEDLSRLGRTAWAREEFRLLEKTEPAERKAPSCFNVKGTRGFAPRRLALLQAFLDLREDAARQWDRPPFKVLSNEVLIAWSGQPPTRREEVLETPGTGKKVLTFLASSVVDAVRRANSLPLEKCPRPVTPSYDPLTERQKANLRRLKKARKKREAELDLPPGMVVNSATLEKLCRTDREEAATSVEILLKSWQQEAFGEDLLNALLAD